MSKEQKARFAADRPMFADAMQQTIDLHEQLQQVALDTNDPAIEIPLNLLNNFFLHFIMTIADEYGYGDLDSLRYQLVFEGMYDIAALLVEWWDHYEVCGKSF